MIKDLLLCSGLISRSGRAVKLNLLIILNFIANFVKYYRINFEIIFNFQIKTNSNPHFVKLIDIFLGKFSGYLCNTYL